MKIMKSVNGQFQKTITGFQLPWSS